jgi:endonuclease YncB( thermonuclease family)
MRLFRRLGAVGPLLAVAALLTGFLAAANQLLSGRTQGGSPRPEPLIARKADAAPGLNKEPQRLLETQEIPHRRDPILLEPPHKVEDARTLVHGLNKVRLAGLDVPARDAVCLNEDESLWACGLRARAALYNLIRGEVIACMPVAAVQGDRIPVRCMVSGTDLGGSLVGQGWARPLAGDGGQYRPETEVAQRERRGLWASGWRFRPTSP